MASYHPPAGFHFKVEFIGVSGMGSDTEQRFQEVSGLSFEIETEILREAVKTGLNINYPNGLNIQTWCLKEGYYRDLLFSTGSSLP